MDRKFVLTLLLSLTAASGFGGYTYEGDADWLSLCGARAHTRRVCDFPYKCWSDSFLNGEIWMRKVKKLIVSGKKGCA
jgi:hypothetical protein